MLKPDSVSKGNIGKIIDKIIQGGFEIIAMKYTRLSTEDASKFYTIRNLFADSISENAIHGSDSDENAIIESNFHFGKDEIFQ